MIVIMNQPCSIKSGVNAVDHAGLSRIISGSVFLEPFNCTRSLSQQGMHVAQLIVD